MGDSDSGGGRPRLRHVLIGLAVIVGLIGIVLLVVLLVHRSHSQGQEEEDAQFEVDSFTLSNLIMGRNESFAAEVRLTARNPNKDTALSYDRVEAVVYYRSLPLARTGLPPFSLDEEPGPADREFRCTGGGNFFERDVASFDLRMSLTSEENEKNKKKKKKKKRRRRRRKKKGSSTNVVNVFCGGLVVTKPTNGKPGALTGGPRPCQVEDG